MVKGLHGEYIDVTDTGNLSQMVQTVKRKMKRRAHVDDTAVGARLDEVIKRVWRTHKALADHIGVTEQSLSRYVGGRIPAGREMAKLAQALPGQIDYILTGREPLGMDRWRALIEAVPEEFTDSLEAYARILGSGDERFVPRLVENLKHEVYMFHAVRRDYPTPPASER
jgi:hypothetical protein